MPTMPPPTITASLLAIRVGSSLADESLPPGIVVVAVRGLGHLLPLRCPGRRVHSPTLTRRQTIP